MPDLSWNKMERDLQQHTGIPGPLFYLSLLLTALPLRAQQPVDPFTDPRDGKVYPVVRIGEMDWMAANLDYRAEGRCYENDPVNCQIYGTLYTWEEALEACPSGWHLPSAEEWKELSLLLGPSDAGQKLKASPDDPVPWDGSNTSGFTALAAGAGNGEAFQRLGQWALFWSASEAGGSRAWFAQLDNFWYPQPPKYTKLYVGCYYLKSNQFSVRCIRDGA